MIRVAIVDDHLLFAEGLTTALRAVPDIEIVGTFSSGNALLEDLPRLDVEVVLLDLEMPDGSGIEVLEELAGSPRAIVVSMHTGRVQRARAVELGACAVLSKSAPLADVAAAVRAVADGVNLTEVTATQREILESYQSPRLDPGAASLTKRERQLLRLMAQGTTATDELAEVLFISQKTVKNHLANIYEKLAISDRAQAAVEAIRLGLDQE